MKSELARTKVGIDFHVWDGIYQGSRSYIFGLYSAAIKQAPDIDFYFFLDDVDSLRNSDEVFRRSNVFLVKMRSRSGVARLGFQLSYLKWRYKLHLFHVQYRLPLFASKGYICTIHDILFETNPEFFSRGFVLQSRLTSKSAALKSDILLVVSEFTKSELVKHYSIPPKNILVVYNGVDAAKFHPAPGGEEVLAQFGLSVGKYVLSIGRLEPRKNQIALVKAYEKLKDFPFKLVFIGQRDFGYDKFLASIADKDLADRILILEKVSDEAMAAILRHAAIFAYPSLAEGFGMPVAEAMASGVPVITSNRTSLPEVAGEGAILVDPESLNELVDALVKVAGSEEIRSQMISRGFDSVARFSWKNSASQLINAIRAYKP